MSKELYLLLPFGAKLNKEKTTFTYRHNDDWHLKHKREAVTVDINELLKFDTENVGTTYKNFGTNKIEVLNLFSREKPSDNFRRQTYKVKIENDNVVDFTKIPRTQESPKNTHKGVDFSSMAGNGTRWEQIAQQNGALSKSKIEAERERRVKQKLARYTKGRGSV